MQPFYPNTRYYFMRILLLFLLSHLTMTGLSQQNRRDSIVERTGVDTLTLTVHFAVDSHVLSAEEVGKAYEFLEKNWKLSKSEVILTGHTDSDASDDYNERLSERRCATVKELLGQLNPSFDSVHVHPFGERHLFKEEQSSDDKALNRRVEISIIYLYSYREIIPCGGYNPCPDTVITLPQGTFYHVDTCWLSKNPKCIQITEFLTPEAARLGGFTTYDSNDEPLQSAGMLKYHICPETVVQVYIPINENCFTADMDLYSLDDKGNWQLMEGIRPEIETVNGRRYYTFPISGNGMINCDKRISLPARQPKVVFKAERGLQLEEVVWSCDCPFTIQNGTPKRKNGKKIKVVRTCCPELQVSITAVDGNGKVYKLPFGDIDLLKSRKCLFGCKTSERKRWFIFKIRKKAIYRRYLVRKIDLRSE